MAFFSKFSINIVTLTEGHPRSYHFKGLPIGYPLANFHNSAINSVRDIANVKVCHIHTHTHTHTRKDAIGSLHRLTLFTHVSQKSVWGYLDLLSPELPSIFRVTQKINHKSKTIKEIISRLFTLYLQTFAWGYTHATF